MSRRWTQLASDLWVVRRPLPLRFVGDIGSRMTVIDLGGELLLHSPVRLDDDLQLELDDRGEVRWIVAPSLQHHLFVVPYLEAYPRAVSCAAPGLSQKRPELRVDFTLGEEGHPDWVGRVWTHLFAGAPTLQEVVFLHRASHTLIVCDLAFNVRSEVRNEARLFHRLVGAADRFGPHRLIRAGIRDKAAARASRDHILEWNFDRVVVSHGEVLETGGRAAWEAAFAFLGP